MAAVVDSVTKTVFNRSLGEAHTVDVRTDVISYQQLAPQQPPKVRRDHPRCIYLRCLCVELLHHVLALIYTVTFNAILPAVTRAFSVAASTHDALSTK